MSIIFSEQLVFFSKLPQIICQKIKFHVGIFFHIFCKSIHSGIPDSYHPGLLRHILRIKCLFVGSHVVMELFHTPVQEPFPYFCNSGCNFRTLFQCIHIGFLVICHGIFSLPFRQVKQPVIFSDHHIPDLCIAEKFRINKVAELHQVIFEGHMILIIRLKLLREVSQRFQIHLRKFSQFSVFIVFRIKSAGKSSPHHSWQNQTSCK